jgi:hypothetical protein
MSETPLESIRRQMRETEERLKRAGSQAAADKSARSSKSVWRYATSDMPLTKAQTEPLEFPSSDWIAYGQMTPGFVLEIARFIADAVREASNRLRARPEPELTRLLQGIDRAKSLLEGWAQSAVFLSTFQWEGTYADLVQRALDARGSEFLRWGIKAEFENAADSVEGCRCTPMLFQAVLHVTQFCIELLRESPGSSRLFVRVQNSGERLETSFVCDFAVHPESAGPAKAGSVESLRSKNVELRAAQKLLDAMGGTLVLENISETRRAIRISLCTSALPLDINLDELSQI